MRAPILALCLVFPVAALAVGADGPPAPTPTTTLCDGGAVWSGTARACLPVGDSRLDDDALHAAAREFAHARQYGYAVAALSAMSDRRSDRVLARMGFAHPPGGAPEEGLAYYAAALAANPDDLMARSYLGQGLAELGDLDGAEAQLAQIRARGGAGTWPELALRDAIRIGTAARS